MNVFELGIKEDLTGKRFGRLLVLAPYDKKNRAWRWKCKCDCGNETIGIGAKMKCGLKKSCGCFKSENVKPRFGANHPGWTGCGELSGSKWVSIITCAKLRNIPFQLTIQEAWDQFEKQGGKCALTGVKLWFAEIGKPLRDCDVTASLDRIDSNKPYIKDNVQWVHKDINIMKQWFNQNYFFDLCKQVVEYNKL